MYKNKLWFDIAWLIQGCIKVRLYCRNANGNILLFLYNKDYKCIFGIIILFVFNIVDSSITVRTYLLHIYYLGIYVLSFSLLYLLLPHYIASIQRNAGLENRENQGQYNTYTSQLFSNRPNNELGLINASKLKYILFRYFIQMQKYTGNLNYVFCMVLRKFFISRKKTFVIISIKFWVALAELSYSSTYFEIINHNVILYSAVFSKYNFLKWY